jgi:predicted MFS family arabinose efflux permease
MIFKRNKLSAYTIYLLLSGVRSFALYTTWLTQNSDSKVRATVISLAGQVDAIGQIAGGPITGLVGNLISIRAAIVSTALMLAPNVFFFTRALRQEKDIPVVVETRGESMPVEAIAEVVPEV